MELVKPETKDLWFRKGLLADEETMSFNLRWGGAIEFGEDRRKDWYTRWIGNADSNFLYRYVRNDEGQFVGECGYHYDSDEDKYLVDVIIMDKFRGNGYGRYALDELCKEAKLNGITKVYDNIAIGNPAVRLFEKCGFKEEYRTDEFVMVGKEL